MQLRFGKWGNAEALHTVWLSPVPAWPCQGTSLCYRHRKVTQEMVQSHLVSHNEIIYYCAAGTTLRVTQKPFGGCQHHEFLTWLGLPKSGSEIPTEYSSWSVAWLFPSAQTNPSGKSLMGFSHLPLTHWIRWLLPLDAIITTFPCL